MMNIKIRFIILVGVIHIGFLHLCLIMLQIWLLTLCLVWKNIGFCYDLYDGYNLCNILHFINSTNTYMFYAHIDKKTILLKT